MDSKLQIISGKYRGKKLKIPAKARPTQQKARGAVFNMLAGIIRQVPAGGMIIWDAFAGSGALGLEFISRFGAARALFTDIDSEAVACIKENSKNFTDCEIIIKNAKCETLGTEMRRFADASVKTPPGPALLIVFVDPPYSDFAAGQKLVADLAQSAPEGTFIVWETDGPPLLGALPGNLAILKDKTYGRARFLIIKKIK